MYRAAIFVVLILVSLLSWWILRIKENKLIRLTRNLKANPTDQSVLEYISRVQRMTIPKREAMFWGHLREAYEVVLHSPIDEAVRQQFLIFLQRKGARWVR